MPQMCPSCGRDNRDTGKFCAHCQAQLMGLLGINATLQGRYQIAGLLGCGGMGAVYLAQDQRLGAKPVAVKENFDTSQQAQQQFQVEAHILANLDHPNLPKVTDHFIEPSSRQYLVMEYVEGEDLESLRQRHPGGQLPEQRVLAWTDALLDALTYLHMQPRPVIHRDIKPANIKLTPQGKLKLVDFGIAKIYRPVQATQTGARASGSPGFAPVEQYAGGTDARSDIYSLGATLYCLLTGQVPPESAALASGQPLTPPRKLRPNLAQGTQAAIFRAMAVNAAQRFQSAAEMRRALQGAPPPPPLQPAPRPAAPPAVPPAAPPRKKAWLWLGCGLMSLVVLGAAGYLAWQLLERGTPTPAATLAAATDTSVPADTLISTASIPTPAGTSPAAPTSAPLAPTTPGQTAAPPDTSIPPTEGPAPTTEAPGPVTASPAGTVYMLGQPWEVEGVSLVATAMAIRSESDYDAAAAQVWFRFFNKMGERLLVEIDWGQIHLEDSLGNRYVDWEGGGTTSAWVEPGRSLDFDRYYTRQPKERSRVPGDAAFVQVVVDQFSRVSGARWQVDINPALAPMAAPDPATVKGVSETWEQDGLALTLKRIEVRAESDYDAAAAQVWFALTNHTNERLLVEIDFNHIYLLDSFGRRFGDWEGGGLWTQWLEPGKSLEFNRYYSEMAKSHSRVTRGAQFVLVKVEKLGRIEGVQWQFDIVR
jgi:serine/threonine protein kinase